MKRETTRAEEAEAVYEAARIKATYAVARKAWAARIKEAAAAKVTWLQAMMAANAAAERVEDAAARGYRAAKGES